MLHLFPHWNWPAREGEEIGVWCYTNLPSVELFLNGKSLGRKDVEKNSHVEWKVPYAPGVIEAVGTHGAGLLKSTRETTGRPVKLNLRADRQQIAADAEDVSVVTVEVVDEKGRAVPTANNLVNFRVDGPARLIGVGNGDPSCHEDDNPSSPREAKRSLFNGLAMALVQSLKQPGQIKLLASADKLDPAWIVLQSEESKARPAL